MEDAILKTVVYLDQFDFAPTLLEIEKWLLKTENDSVGNKNFCSLHDIQKIIEQNKHLTMKDGLVMLTGREELTEIRKATYNYTETKWKRAKPFLRLLSYMPGVKAIWFCNTMGWNHAKKNSDIDLCIVTRPGQIWTTRFFTTALMKLLRQRPGQQEHSKAICLSFYVTEDGLHLEQYQLESEDIPFAFWAAQMYPIFDPADIYTQYQTENNWLNTVFQHLHWTRPSPKRRITHNVFERLFKIGISWITPETLLKKFQMKYFPKEISTQANKDERVVVSDTILKLHTNDNRLERKKQWQLQVNKYL